MICAAENSNNFQKIRFWKEKSVEDEVTLERTTQVTLVYIYLVGSLTLVYRQPKRVLSSLLRCRVANVHNVSFIDLEFFHLSLK